MTFIFKNLISFNHHNYLDLNEKCIPQNVNILFFKQNNNFIRQNRYNENLIAG